MQKTFKMVPVIYPESKKADLKITKIKIPSEIKRYLDQLEKVKRFNHLQHDHPGLIDDNTKDHTIRCVYRARTIPFTHPDIVRTMWIHDIPEHGGESDLSAIERFRNPKKALEMEAKEKSIAKETLSQKDFALYEDFSRSEDFLRRGGKKIPQNQQTLIANAIDLLDGNLVYAYFVTKWLKEHDFKKESFQVKEYSYTVEIRQKFLKAVEKPEVENKVREAVEYLFNSSVLVMIKLWSEVEDEKIPPQMKSGVMQLRNIICH